MKESYRALSDKLPVGYDFVFIARNTICGKGLADVCVLCNRPLRGPG